MGFKIGDIVEADRCLGIIVDRYREGGWDWEIYFLGKSPCNCKQDCYYGHQLKLSDKKPKIPKKILNKMVAEVI